MKKLVIGIAVIIAVAFFGLLTYQFLTSKPTTTTSNQQIESPTEFPKMNVKIAVISLENFVQEKNTIGCGDSVIFQNREIEPTKNQIQGALEELFKQTWQFSDDKKIYNSLYQSTLTVKDIVITNKQAQVFLEGEIKLGGVCDNPRFKAQIEKTALQFPIANSVSIFLNGKPIDQALQMKQ